MKWILTFCRNHKFSFQFKFPDSAAGGWSRTGGRGNYKSVTPNSAMCVHCGVAAAQQLK